MEASGGVVQPESSGRKHFDRTLLALLIITLVGGVIRFRHLERPPLLIDECFTFWRTCGSYGDLVDTLRDDGFVPLHYELLWWVHAGMPIGGWHIVAGGIYLTPKVMRFIPAVCGTLMIPTIYFVARQLLGKRASILAALFVACSAYALFFSRDSKMYMPEWFLGTLEVGCLLWWLRTRSWTAWLAWIAAGAAAAGFHIVTLLLLPLAPLFFVTQRRVHWKQAVLLVVGCVLIVSGPAGYYGTFNRWSQKSGGLVPGVANEPAPDANWGASGLNWLGQGDSGAGEGFTSLSAYLMAYEWNGSADPSGWQETLAWIRRSVVASICAILGFVVLGAIPWPGKFRAAADGATEPWWRTLLWLMLWIVLPAYGFFYLRSFDDPASPGDWLSSAGGLWGARWIWLVLLMIALAVAATRWRIVALVSSGVVAFFFLLAGILTACGEMELASVLDHRLILWVALIVVPTTVWALCGNTIRERLVKLGQLVFVVGFVLLLCTGAHIIWGQLRAASLAKNPDLPWQTIWHTRYVGIVWPAVWIGVAALIARVPTRAMRVFAIVGICAVNLVNGIARTVAQTQVPYDRALADVWLSQPNSSTRTYFDLNEGVVSFMSGSGMPSGAYWRPIAAYDACLAGRIKTTPADFRVGKTWPFNYGPMMDRFESSVVYRPTVSADEIAADVGKSPEARRVIVWETTHNTSAENDGLAKQLGAGWRLAHEDVVQVWWYWDWSPRSMFRRREFVKG